MNPQWRHPGVNNTFASAILALLLYCGLVDAAIDEAALANSIVTVSNYHGKSVNRQGNGFVVQSDRFNGYVLTNMSLVAANDTLTVSVPNSGAELIAQVLQMNESMDLAVLKVNGLNLPALKFNAEPITVGETIWTAAKSDQTVGLAKGILQSSLREEGQAHGVIHHNATPRSGGSLLLNDCGQVIGINQSGSASNKAIDVATVKQLLGLQNIKMTVSTENCATELELAKSEAEDAAFKARQAQTQAEQARKTALGLESQLDESNQRNDSLEAETKQAWARAETALKQAASAKENAEKIQQELDSKTSDIQAETSAILETLNRDRMMAEQRFQQALDEQKKGAERREIILLSAVGVLFVFAIITVIFLRARGQKATTDTRERPASRTEMHNGDLSEYVLDGRDEDGIRYLLRISGDQLNRNDGVVIGRNPKDSPYIINHSDVSRKHARIRLMKDRVFIEDLGSTNGTSVNGQAIEDKGLVTVNHGDQIIIGSVVMKLRVLED